LKNISATSAFLLLGVFIRTIAPAMVLRPFPNIAQGAV